MNRILIAYIATGVSFAAIDAVWLRTMMTALYKPEMGPLLADKARMGPAVLFYIFYIAGIVYFAVAPALANGGARMAALNGAVLGFLCYMTYDLTNHAVMKQWSVKLSALDIAWGTLLTAMAATIGWWAANRISA